MLIGLTAMAATFGGFDGKAQATEPGASDSKITYPSEFFEQYRPSTAFDMVNQLPGFQVNDGPEQRGLSDSLGNVLINGRYPRSKQDKASAMLARIPATQVVEIELVRGHSAEFDTRNYPAVANVILQADGAAALRWDVSIRKNLRFMPMTPDLSLSQTGRWREITYNVGLDARRPSYGHVGWDTSRAASQSGAVERNIRERGYGTTANLYAGITLASGATHLNATAFTGTDERTETLSRVTTDPDSSSSIESNWRDRLSEAGITAERAFGIVDARAILLLARLRSRNVTSDHFTGSQPGDFRIRSESGYTESSENISRLEFAGDVTTRHRLQLDLEYANNALSSELTQSVTTIEGTAYPALPGANSRVEEKRYDILLSDTWDLGAVTFQYGIGAELSSITQTGELQNERRFTYFKPLAVLTRSFSSGHQLRVRLQREVAQLNFDEFISASDFADDDLLFGNPELRPETVWVAEISSEIQVNRDASLTLAAFHHWISDVEDLLPVSDNFEVSGNIGSGSRWGLELALSTPLTAFGLDMARIDIAARYQESAVTDPVTGQRRELSAPGGHRGGIAFDGDNRYALSVEYIQTLSPSNLVWGWSAQGRAERPAYKVNEFSTSDEGFNIDAFIEAPIARNLRVRLSVQNLLDQTAIRTRQLYAGRRGLSAVSSVEYRELQNGRRFLLSFGGTI